MHTQEMRDLANFLCYKLHRRRLPAHGAGFIRMTPDTPFDSPSLGHDESPMGLKARLAMTLGPIGGYILLLLAAGILSGYRMVLFLASMFLAAFVGGGKFIVFAGAVPGSPVGIWPLAAIVVWGDMATVCFLVANIEALNRIPRLGTRIAQAHAAGHQVLATHTWMRRAAELGLIVFIALPFQGTGSVIGVILGRILGLSRGAIVLSVFAGSTLGALAMSLLAYLGRAEIAAASRNPWLGVLTLVLVFSLMWYLGKRFLGAK